MSPYQETSPTEEIEIEPKCAEQVETCPTHEYKCAHLLPLTASYFLLTRSLAKHSLDPQKSTKSRANRLHLLREESSLDFCVKITQLCVHWLKADLPSLLDEPTCLVLPVARGVLRWIPTAERGEVLRNFLAFVRLSPESRESPSRTVASSRPNLKKKFRIFFFFSFLDFNSKVSPGCRRVIYGPRTTYITHSIRVIRLNSLCVLWPPRRGIKRRERVWYSSREPTAV